MASLDDEQEEITGCTHRAYMGDPVAAKVKSLESRALKLESHFEGPGPGQMRGGMVYELVQEWHATKTWIKSIPVVVIVASALIGGVIWISSRSPSAQDIAREIQRAQQK